MAKRLVDVVGATLALLVLWPLLLLAATGVLLTLGRPVLFRQVRPGLHGEPFVLHKLRTMHPVDLRRPDRLTDEDRLTRFGRLLRATSIDELPELVDVLRGRMSLVGPRPLLPEYLERYSPRQARRHEVRPGITGLAQVRGRNGLSWDQKFELDVRYVETRSLGGDLRILLATPRQVLKRSGISAAGHATAPMFTGAPSPEHRP